MLYNKSKILCIILTLILVFSLSACKEEPKEYTYTTEKPSKTMVPVSSFGYNDLYSTDYDSLENMSGMIYKGDDFGEITNEEQAAKAATTVIFEIYGNAFDGYEPLVVTFNERANCWIVHGTPQDNRNSGVCFVALYKPTGKVVMVLKNKKVQE